MSDKYYYVASNGASPERIYFTEVAAMDSGYKYIDLFGAKGLWIESYQWNGYKYKVVD